MTIINHEYYISLEVAKLLKKAGFDWKCMCYYTLGNSKIHIPNNGAIAFMKKYEDLFRNHNETKLPIYSAPTLDVAQRWLREVKSFMVETTFITDEYSILYQANLYEVISEKAKGRVSELISVVKGQSELKRTYEEAQEAGIKKALEMILKKGDEQ